MPLEAGKDFLDFKTVDIGKVELPAGAMTVTVRPLKKPGVAVMDLRRIELAGEVIGVSALKDEYPASGSIRSLMRRLPRFILNAATLLSLLLFLAAAAVWVPRRSGRTSPGGRVARRAGGRLARVGRDLAKVGRCKRTTSRGRFTSSIRPNVQGGGLVTEPSPQSFQRSASANSGPGGVARFRWEKIRFPVGARIR